MMMWTKNSVSLSRADGEGGNVHEFRRTRDGEPEAAPRTRGPQVVQVQEGTPEQIAYQLFLNIVEAEDPFSKPAAHHLERRDYILSTYAQCIRTVREGTSR